MSSGYFTIAEDIAEPLRIVQETEKCDLNMENCVTMRDTTIFNMCMKRYRDKSIFAEGSNAVSPEIDCPPKAGRYEVNELITDMAAFSLFLPHDFIYIATARTYSGPEKKEVMCMQSETKITRVPLPTNPKD